MSPILLRLTLLSLALIPLQARPQGAAPMPGQPIDLGTIPLGEERMLEIRGRLDFAIATVEETMAAAQPIVFSIEEDSGFCAAISVPGEAAAFSLIGEAVGIPEPLFNVGTGLGGLASDLGRRSLIASVAPIEPTAFALAAIVGQSQLAPGDTVNLFLRTYLDTTPAVELAEICGESFSVRGAVPAR